MPLQQRLVTEAEDRKQYGEQRISDLHESVLRAQKYLEAEILQ